MAVAKKVQWRAHSSYAKSADTRHAILQAAIIAFSEAGFASVSTRRIAAQADVNQPAIGYYFESKQGLYLACAQEIITRYTARTNEATVNAVQALEVGTSPNNARLLLQELLAALTDLMISANDPADGAAFVEREMREHGPAYNFLYQNFWAPGIDLVAQLVAAIKGEDIPSPLSRTEAIMLISSLVAFTSEQSVAIEAMGWQEIGPSQVAIVMAALEKQINAIS